MPTLVCSKARDDEKTKYEYWVYIEIDSATCIWIHVPGSDYDLTMNGVFLKLHEFILACDRL